MNDQHAPPARRDGRRQRQGPVPLWGLLLLLIGTQGLAVALSVAGRGGHAWLAWGLGAGTLAAVVASVLALAPRHEVRGPRALAPAFAIVVHLLLTVALTVGAGPALRDTYLGLVGESEPVTILSSLDDENPRVGAGASREARRSLRLRLQTLAGGPVRGGSTVLEAQVPGDVYARYTSRVRAGEPPSSWPTIVVRVDPLGIVAPLPVDGDGSVARTSPLLPAGWFFVAVLAAWLALVALVALPAHRAAVGGV